MASPAQVLANRENAQHSTGPRTPEGKRTSAFNALRHGITSQLALLPTEDAAAYEALCAKFKSELNPRTALEQTMAQTVCDNRWRIERTHRAESAVLTLVHHEPIPDHIQSIDDPAERDAMLEAHAQVKYESVLRNIQLQDARLQKLFTKSLADLRAEQSRRRQAETNFFTQAINARTWHIANEEPFVPADHGFVFTTGQIDAERKRRHMQSNPVSPWGLPQINTKADLQNAMMFSTFLPEAPESETAGSKPLSMAQNQ